MRFVPKKALLTALIPLVIYGFTDPGNSGSRESVKMPHRKAGLSHEQAAAHLLSRFTLGATPQQVKAVVDQGLNKWFIEQLDGKLPDEEVARRLPTDNYPALTMSNEAIVAKYVNAGQAIRLAVKNKLITADSVAQLGKPEYRQQLQRLMKEQGLENQQDLNRQLLNQKIVRAAYGSNQLHEVMTDFWFNHFNVSLTKGSSQRYVLTYERDAIRPNVVGNFSELLLSTARHPAMLEYLDNVSSVSNNNEFSRRREQSAAAQRLRRQLEKKLQDTSNPNQAAMQQLANRARMQGLNENYAREVMELHTLGVDGGYTQEDVTQVARALTGWTIRPLNSDNPMNQVREMAGRAAALAEKDNVEVGDFLFRANRHDEGEKTILGKAFDGKAGYREGVEVLQHLAEHPSTATFICKKIAIRFVCDSPSLNLVQAMATTFQKTKGNIRSVLITMVNQPAFWEASALREKVKSPLELAISAIRASQADVQQPLQISNWITRMGQRLYSYAAPTGYPDRANFWINTGSLLNRMNFGIAFAAGRIPGVKMNWLALNDNHEPESAEDALRVYSQLLLPERNQEENIRRLTALLKEQQLEEKIKQASDMNNSVPAMEDSMAMASNEMKEMPERRRRRQLEAMAENRTTTGMPVQQNTLQQVAGIIIGSPEFQRR
ncbi:MAG: DUF1800 domain-containing protein [Sediminibacterium sp.]|jgi:uncharacterized protein (DUF1800 family)|nr:DUF1800 domain-containing protein [Sediminibacterium sp.]